MLQVMICLSNLKRHSSSLQSVTIPLKRIDWFDEKLRSLWKLCLLLISLRYVYDYENCKNFEVSLKVKLYICLPMSYWTSESSPLSICLRFVVLKLPNEKPKLIYHTISLFFPHLQYPKFNWVNQLPSDRLTFSKLPDLWFHPRIE